MTMTVKLKSTSLSQGRNSWYLKIGYLHHFLCKCGQTDQFGSMIGTTHHPDHRCSHCGNTHYLDSTMFRYQPAVIRWSKFYWETEKIKTNNEWIVRAYAVIPVFDTKSQKIVREKIILSSIRLGFDGEESPVHSAVIIRRKCVYNDFEKPRKLQDLIEAEISSVLIDFVLENPIPEIAWIRASHLERLIGFVLENRIPEIEWIRQRWRIKLFSPERMKKTTMMQLNFLGFFLAAPYLKEEDFFYWMDTVELKGRFKEFPTVQEMLLHILNHRTEKSLKKAMFQSYKRSMETRREYNILPDYIFTRQIADRNHLKRLIELPMEIKHRLFLGYTYHEIAFFLDFLKHTYNEKSIVRLFESIRVTPHNTYVDIVKDTLRMFYGEAAQLISEHFVRVAPDFQKLHDEFIRINAMRKVIRRRRQIVFDYLDNDRKAQTTVEELTYRLPQDSQQLHEWAQVMYNCMYGYASAIGKGESLIYGVFREDVLQYAIEIHRHEIVQALGRYNARIIESDRDAIDRWFQKIYMKEWMQGNN